MRGFRLNGWQRIGIVLSVVWVIGGGLWGNAIAIRDGGATAETEFGLCLDKPNHNYDACSQTFAKDYAKGVAGHWYAAAFIGLVPIPIAWLLVYGLIALVRWIRRGFQPLT
jgi:hypothetical protein